MGPPPRFLSDDQLASRAACGSRAAEGEIFARHHRALVGFCRSILLDVHDADEAAQAALVKAIDALRKRPLDAPLRPWLFRIAHNEAINVLRARRTHTSLADVTAAVPAVDVTADQRERLKQLVTDLQALPDRQRAALLMREMSGLSYPEIALSLETTEHATRQVVFEARQTLTEFREGRALECSSVRDVLEAGDRRVLRGKRLRAHLRGCPDCTALQAGMTARRRDLRLLIPALPATGLAAMLGGGAAATGGAVKVAVGALAVTATVGVVELEVRHPDPKPRTAIAAEPHKPKPRVKAQAAAPTPEATAARKPARHRRAAKPARKVKVKAPVATLEAPVRQRPAVHHRPAKRRPPAAQAPAATPAPQAVRTPAPTPQSTPTPAATQIAATDFGSQVRANNQLILEAALAQAQQDVDAALADAQTMTNDALAQAQAQLEAAMAQLQNFSSYSP